MKIVIATGNSHKVDEIGEIFQRAMSDITVCGAEQGLSDVVEDAETFEGNAKKKADAVALHVLPGQWVLADDSGLIVDALDGKPGVHSSRYAGENSSDDENIVKLLNALTDVPGNKCTARFVSCLVLIDPQKNTHVFTGICEGRIIRKRKGSEGFGYDPIFVPEGYDNTFAELGSDVKSKISHRAKALCLLFEWLGKVS